MHILIKNMVCRHCVETVYRVAAEFPELKNVNVGLGYMDADCDTDLPAGFIDALLEQGFEIIRSREAEIVESVKSLLRQQLRGEPEQMRFNVSDLLSEKLNMSYTALSRLFSEAEERTIENYLISLRVELVKELIRYEQLTLGEIADRTGYSSVAHLSSQFKQTTGMTPTEFRRLGTRKPLTEV